MTNLRRARSRAASVPRDDARVTEMINGIIVSKPAKKVTHLSNQEEQKQESELEVIDLQEYAKPKAGSVPSTGVNKVKAIHNFMFSNGRI